MNSLYILFNEIYKILFLLIPVLVTVAMIVWLDRRVWAFVQKRKGPNVVGPFGLFQTLADALKYIFKEIIIPASANKVVFILAPIVTMTLALVAWAVIPMSEDLVLANINKSVLLQFLSKIKNNNSIIILSGFLKNDFDEMKNIILKVGCNIIKTYNKREWLCFVIK